MLTQAELTDARDKLKEAEIIITAVKWKLLGGGNSEAAKTLNELGHILSDEIKALEKSIGRRP